jgi:NAD/NADP transhydrogenase beta subunit
MNRSIWNVIFGGFGHHVRRPPKPAADGDGRGREIDVADDLELLAAKEVVVIVPGYGMAVARAQHRRCER